MIHNTRPALRASGCNENLNGLIRQYIPKGCDISLFTDEEIQQIADKLNRRPRERLINRGLHGHIRDGRDFT